MVIHIRTVKRTAGIFICLTVTIAVVLYAIFAFNIVLDDYQEANQPSYHEGLNNARMRLQKEPGSVAKRLSLVHYLSLTPEDTVSRREAVRVLTEGLRISPDSEELRSRLQDFTSK